jgi:hypothetical protein
MDHHPLSPYLTPNDFYLFGPLTKYLAGKVFATDADMKQAVTSWLQKLDKDFFMLGYMPLCHSGTIHKCQW